MEKTVFEQERDIKDVIRRAKGIPDKTGSLRRETLKRLIDLIHSPHSTLKILAAQNIRFFFNDFPELEEVAINAVYDLCEDQSSKVRIEGYTAITQVSRTENKWVKRNADVLLQLLQSDEPDEVIVVKKALTEHLDMDPRITLGVLCDQIIPPEEPMDEEEQAIRDRLRSLVLSFLTGEAKRAIVERHAVPGSAAEDVLVSCLLEAIPKLSLGDVEIIVKNLLLSLTAYKPGSSRGDTLLRILLDQITSYLRSGLRSGNVTSLRSVRMYLDLVAFFVIEKRAAPAIQLLRFYCSHLSSRMTLQKFPQDDRVSIICNISETFVAANKDSQPQDDGQPLEALRKQIVDACPFLLESLCKYDFPHKRFVDACTTLLRACIHRRDESPWAPPPHLITVLKNFQPYENTQDIQILIRSLVPTPNNPSQGQASDTIQALKNVPPQPKTNDNGRPSSLPEKPPAARRMMLPTRNRPPDQLAEPRSHALMTTSTPFKHSLSQQESSRSPKRRREDGDEDIGPSLLSRLGSSLSTDPSRPVPRVDSTSRSNSPAQNPPEFGYSIKGAAKTAARAQSDTRHSMETPSFSLLDRLENNSLTQLDDRASGSWKKKKRGRAY